MDLLSLRTRMRRFLDDYEGEERFSDERIDEALNQSQVEACRRSDLIVDSKTESVCKIRLEPHVAYYPIDSRIKKIRQVRHHCHKEGEGRRYEYRQLHQVDTNHSKNRTFGAFGALGVGGYENVGHVHGRPEGYILDKETGSLYLDRCLEVVGDDEFLSLTVVRLPITLMIHDEDEPEILEAFHLPLCYWAVFLLLSDNDPETYDPAKADRFSALFATEFGEPVTANQHFKRLYNKKLRATARFV